MALRDKLKRRTEEKLGPGQPVYQVFMGQTGPSPYWAFLSWWILIFGARYRVFALTNSGLHVFSASGWWPSKPKELLYTITTPTLPEVSGIWTKGHINNDKVWLHRRFKKDVAATQLALGQLGAVGPTKAPPGQYLPYEYKPSS